MSVITITISINVPDGAKVAVSNGGGSSTFTPRPEPAYPEADCPECGASAWRLIKAGVSKTKVDEHGNPKRFNAFYTCGTEGCNGKPPRFTDSAVDELGF